MKNKEQVASDVIKPGSMIGIIGGGQLGRMMAIAAKQMGYKIAVLDPTKNSPTGQIADIEINAQYSNFRAIKKLANCCDVITYEFENINVDVLRWLEENSNLPQGSKLIEQTQDRYFEKEVIKNCGVKVAPFELVFTEQDLYAACQTIGFPAVLKTRQGGYDGKGQILLGKTEDVKKAQSLLREGACILEKFISFEKELSVIVSRNKQGEMTAFPVSENIHVDHILMQSIVPARISEEMNKQAREIALTLANDLQITGTLAVEMFACANGEIYVNELAPRPHNSGHYTMDGCATSQFEQHIRAICNWPLSSTKLVTPTIMMNILGEQLDNVLDSVPSLNMCKLHLYGKEEVKKKRKMGHINFPGEDIQLINENIRKLDIWKVEKLPVHS